MLELITYIVFFFIALFMIRYIGRISNGLTIEKLGRLEYILAGLLAFFYPIIFILIAVYFLCGSEKIVKFIKKYL